MAILKRQLEEKEKLLATEQEDAAVAKSKLRELNKVRGALALSREPQCGQCCACIVGSLSPHGSSLGSASVELPLSECATA